MKEKKIKVFAGSIDLLVHFKPRLEALCVCEGEAKEPHLPEPNRLHNLNNPEE